MLTRGKLANNLTFDTQIDKAHARVTRRYPMAWYPPRYPGLTREIMAYGVKKLIFLNRVRSRDPRMLDHKEKN
jgi:hypothetical protein